MGGYKIFWEVYGGKAGYSCGYLQRDGEDRVFDNRDEAVEIANQLQTSKDANPYRRADFRYRVDPA